MALHPVRDLANKRRFRKAKVEAARSGEVVCAYFDKTGRPVYFTAPAGTADYEVEARVFQDYYGRPITPADQMLQRAARAVR